MFSSTQSIGVKTMRKEITELKGTILNRIETEQKYEYLGVCTLFTDSGSFKFEYLGTIMQVNITKYHYIDNAYIVHKILSEGEDLIVSTVTYLVINGILCCQWVD